jgi:hypothetical protein
VLILVKIFCASLCEALAMVDRGGIIAENPKTSRE